MRGRPHGYFAPAVLALSLTASPMQTDSQAQEPNSNMSGSVLDGIFTADQAARGEETFQRICSVCHTVAEHTGRKFEERWGGSTVGDLFDLISNTMPDGNPGSLMPEEYAAVLAFLFKETGYPEGKQELPADKGALTKLKIEPLPR